MAERWLVIDDSSTIQRVIKLAFQGYDVHITEADSCQEAAREMMTNQPTLVIADAALGGVQGVQDFLALKTQAPQAPFIILEGSYDNIDEAQFRAAGFRHFLKKPFDGSQLLSITRQALGRALPYRGEAAVAAAAGAPQPAPTATMPPPPPPMRNARSMMENATSFPAENTNPGFDLGLHDSRAPDPRAIAQTLVSTVDPRHMAADPRALAQTQISPAIPANDGRGMNTMVNGNDGRGMNTMANSNDGRGMNTVANGNDGRGMNTMANSNDGRGMNSMANSMHGNDGRGISPMSGGVSSSDGRTMGQNQMSGSMINGDPNDGREAVMRDMASEHRGGGQAAGHGGDIRSMIAAEARSMASAHLNAMSQSGNFGRKESVVETTRNPVSFSLEDDEPVVPQISAPGRDKDTASWDGLPRPAGTHLGNLLEPMLQEEMEKIVRVAVEDYCRKHFAGIARELIQRELDRLTQDRSRLLMD